MKKRLSFLAMAFFAVLSASAQMFAYEVSTTTSDYQEITNGIVADLGDNTGTDLSKLLLDNDGNANVRTAEDVKAFPIGFDLNYNSKTMKYFLIGTDGEIVLSDVETVTTEIANSATNMFTTSGCHDAFGIVTREGVYGYEDTEISYKTEGEPGNRVLIIQYKNLGLQSGQWNVDVCAKVQMQYRVYEATGNISMQVKDFAPTDVTGNFHFMRIGLLGDSKDFIQVQAYDGSVTGVKDTNIKYSAELYPADGTTYIFEHPEECMRPDEMETLRDLQLTSTSTQINGTFKPSGVDHYLVLAGTAAPEEVNPADLKKYVVGDELGNAKVIAVVEIMGFGTWNDSPSFSSPNNMESSTEYYVTLIPYNAVGANGPLYGTATTATVKTKPAAPEALAITSIDKDNLTLSLSAVAGSQVVIALSEIEAINSIGQSLDHGEFGTPEGNYKVGDVITFDYDKYIGNFETKPAQGTNTIVYVGESNDNIELTGLEIGKAYWFRAWTTDGEGNYSSVYQEVGGITAAELPWAFVPDMSGSFTPLGWEIDPNYTWTNNSHADPAYFYNTISFTGTEEVKETWMLSPYIYLGEGTNTLKVSVGASMFTFRTFAAPTYEMQEGEEIAVQVTTDGETFTNILTLNKDNMPTATLTDDDGNETEGNAYESGKFYDQEVDFTEFAGQKVRLRFYVKRYTNGGAQFANLSLTNKAGEAAEASVTYAIQTGETFTSGQTVEVKDGGDVVATITYGEDGGADFKAAKANAAIEGFVAFTEGNGENGNKAGGTFYTIVPNYGGEITIGVVLNNGKAFYVLEDGTALADYNGITVSEKYYGTYTFSVKAGKSYKFYCSGSKLGFYGFNYIYDMTATGIESAPVVTVKSDAVYNLQGQRMTTLVPGQLYIQNGRKFIAR